MAAESGFALAKGLSNNQQPPGRFWKHCGQTLQAKPGFTGGWAVGGGVWGWWVGVSDLGGGQTLKANPGLMGVGGGWGWPAGGGDRWLIHSVPLLWGSGSLPPRMQKVLLDKLTLRLSR